MKDLIVGEHLPDHWLDCPACGAVRSVSRFTPGAGWCNACGATLDVLKVRRDKRRVWIVREQPPVPPEEQVDHRWGTVMATPPPHIPSQCGHENRRWETFDGCACTGELCPDCGMVLAFRPISRKHVRLHTNLTARADVEAVLFAARQGQHRKEES